MANNLIGILLINLGTPEEATPEKVKPYLREFLMDKLVIDIPYLFRWVLVNGIILRKRHHTSAAAYKKIWTDKGSPLMVHTLKLAEELHAHLGPDFRVVPAMRYGKPSIGSGLERLKDCSRVVALPLYPQYSLAATQSCIDEAQRAAKKLKISSPIHFLPAFYDSVHFIKAFSDQTRELIDQKKPDHVIFSFHGVPERHVKKTDRQGNHCLKSPSCCDMINEKNRNCYRAQCFATAKLMASDLNLEPSMYTVSFQSRLGRTPWIKPYTDFLYKELAAKGVRNVLVVSPSFVADCLETLEEIAIRGKADFVSSGGSDLHLVPSLNSRPSWVKALGQVITDNIKTIRF